MLRWGNGSVELTCTGARGAPITPSKSLRSDLLENAVDATEGVLESCPFIQWPKLDPTRFESPTSPPSGSGPSINGVSVSPNGLKLPDLDINCSWFGAKLLLLLLFFLRSKLVMGDPLLAGLLALDLPGDNPRTTSSFNAEKKPCFLSIFQEKKTPTLPSSISFNQTTYIQLFQR